MATSVTATAYRISDDLSLDSPDGVAIDTDLETVCIADTGNDTIYLAHAEGLGSITTLDEYDSNDFTNPRGILYHDGYFYVCNASGHTLVRLRARDLAYKDHFGTNASAGAPAAGKLRTPSGVTTDGEHLYVSESGANRVTKLDFNLAYVDSATDFGGYSISAPWDIVCNLSGDKSLFISDTTNQRILKIGKDFSYVDNVGSLDPYGITLYNDMIHVCDAVDNDIKVYDTASLTHQATISSTASSLDVPYGIAQWRGVLFIADSVNDRVVAWKRYNPRDALTSASGAKFGGGFMDNPIIVVGVDTVTAGATDETSPNRWKEENPNHYGVGWDKETISLSDPGWSKE